MQVAPGSTPPWWPTWSGLSPRRCWWLWASAWGATSSASSWARARPTRTGCSAASPSARATTPTGRCQQNRDQTRIDALTHTCTHLCVLQSPGDVLPVGSLQETLQLCAGGPNEEAHPVTQVEPKQPELEDMWTIQPSRSVALLFGFVVLRVETSCVPTVLMEVDVCRDTARTMSV